MMPGMRPTWANVPEAAPAPLGNPSENQALIAQWSQGLGGAPAPGPLAASPSVAGPAPAGLLPRSALATPAGPARPLETLGAPRLGFGAFTSSGPSGPTGVDTKQIITGPGSGAVARGPAPGQSQGDWMAAMNPAEREQYNLIEAQKQEELRKRASGGQMVKGGKVQTAETISGVVGPDKDKLAAYLRSLAQGQDQAKALATFDRDINFRRADNAGDLQAKAAEDAAREEQMAMAHKEALGQIRGRLDGLREQVMNGEVRPDRLWSDASTAQRAGFMVAAALSGIGAAVAGRGGGPNTAIESLMRMMDRDNDRQRIQQAGRREKLNDAHAIYQETKEAFGSELAGEKAANLAKLEALKQQFETEYQTMAAKMPINAGRDPVTGEVIEKTALDVRKDQAVNAIDQRIAKEQMELSKELNGQFSKNFGFTQDRYVGGSSGPSLAKLAAMTGAQGKLARDAQKADADNRGDLAKAATQGAPAIYSGGQRYAVDPSMPKDLISKNQSTINMADLGLATLDAIEKNPSSKAMGNLEKGARVVGLDRLANAMAPDDRVMGADQLTGILAQTGGSGVPSPVQAALAQAAFSGGPGQAAAIAEARRQLRSNKQIGLSNLGVKLWPRATSPSTTRRRARRSRPMPRRRVTSCGRGPRASCPIKRSTSSTRPASSRPSAAPTPRPTSRAPRPSSAGAGWPMPARPAASGSRRSSGASAGSSGLRASGPSTSLRRAWPPRR